MKPLLSCEVDISKVNFPIYVSTKFDGIRALVKDGVVYSRSLKPIRNKHVQQLFGKPEYEGFDGELVVGDIYAKDVFQKTTSGVMSEGGTPNVKFYVFDLWNSNADYGTRVYYYMNMPSPKDPIIFVEPKLIENKDQLMELLENERNIGGEGLIGRNPRGFYKYGRSTPKEQLSIKFKFFEQDEFKVVGFEELHKNLNESVENELGYLEKSTHKQNLTPMNTLGSIVLKYGDQTFKCGTGFSQELRKEIWDNRNIYLGKLASIRYMSVGVKDLPRVPSFIGFRDEDDI